MKQKLKTSLYCAHKLYTQTSVKSSKKSFKFRPHHPTIQTVISNDKYHIHHPILTYHLRSNRHPHTNGRTNRPVGFRALRENSTGVLRSINGENWVSGSVYRGQSITRPIATPHQINSRVHVLSINRHSRTTTDAFGYNTREMRLSRKNVVRSVKWCFCFMIVKYFVRWIGRVITCVNNNN